MRANVARRNAAGERVRVLELRIVKIRDSAAAGSTASKKNSLLASRKTAKKCAFKRDGKLKTREAYDSNTE